MDDYIKREDVIALVKLSISDMVAYAMGKKDHATVLDVDAINAIPSADVKPVVYARWKLKAKNKPKQLICTNCHTTPVSKIIMDGEEVWDEPCIELHMRYCPYCGATMTRR